MQAVTESIKQLQETQLKHMEKIASIPNKQAEPIERTTSEPTQPDPQPIEKSERCLQRLSSDFYNLTTPKKFQAFATEQVIETLLELNTSNRKLDEKMIRFLAQEIVLGKWKDVSDVVISKSGLLLDGQHRLHALKESGYPKVKFWIHAGVDESYRDAIDQGKRRTVQDIIALQAGGVVPNTHLRAVINFLNRLTEKLSWKGRVIPISVPRMRTFYEEFSKRIDFEAVDPVISSKPFKTPPVLAAMFQYSAVDPNHTYNLCYALATGTELEENSPILNFRNKFLEQPSMKGNNQKASTYRKLVATILSEREGRKLSRLPNEINSWGDIQSQIWFPDKEL